MEDKRYEIFEGFYRNAYLIIRRMSAYYGLTQEELKQECAIVFFENPNILECYSSSNKLEAFKLFGASLRGSLRDFSSTGVLVRNSADYERQKNAMERIFSGTPEDIDAEDEIMNRLEIEGLRAEHGDKYIDDIIEYYDLGDVRYSKKYNLKGATARTRIYRKLKKIRDKKGVI
ncbi:MAG: hypothetical protein ACRCX2_01275 [Paraclostridium sp.]